MTRGRRAGLAPAAAAVAVVAAAIAPRIAPQWSAVVESGAAIVRDPDASYHLRRAGRIAAQCPDLALFDPFINHPHGAYVIWPPLYDLLLAGAVAAAPSPDDAAATSVTVALLPPLLFSGAVGAVLVLARRLWPAGLGLPLFAAGLAALAPASLPYTALGQLDHHAAELLLAALFVAALGGAAATCGRAPRAAPVPRVAIPPGLALAAALLVQLSLAVLVPLPFAVALLARAEERAHRLELAVWICGIALALVLPWALAYHAAGAPIRHYQFGLFQPALLALAALAGVAARAAAAPTRRAPRALVIAVAGGMAALLAARLAPELARGARYAAGTFAAWQGAIGESRSLVRLGWPGGVREALASLGGAALLAPVGTLMLARRSLARRRTVAAPPRRGAGAPPAARVGDDTARAHAAAAAAALALFAPLGVLQARFLPHVALFAGVAAAAAAAPISARLGGRLGDLALAAALAALLWPTRGAWRAREEAATAFDRARPVLAHLARAASAEPATPADAGVVAEWSYGHFIQHHGRHPAVVDNFGDHAGDPTQVRAFFLETDEERAIAFLDSVRARFVLVGDLASTFSGMIPDEALRARYIASAAVGAGGVGAVRFAPAIASTLLHRLARGRGGGSADLAAGFVPALSRLRLVAESDSMEALPDGSAVPCVALYEKVAGARLSIDGLAPGRRGVLLAAIRSPRGRVFPYVAPLVAGADGRIEVCFPYATAEGTSSADSPIGDGAPAVAVRCAIDLGDTTLALGPVTESMVLDGRAVMAAITPPARPPEAGATGGAPRDDPGGR